MNMEFKRRLPAPQDIINMYPVSDEMAAKKAANAVVEEESPVTVSDAPTSDDEIVAVIAAAIAMAESECSDTKFRVVSFKRK